MKKELIAIIALTAFFTLEVSAFSLGLKGDFDLDGDVDADDLAVFSENFGKNSGTCTDSDNCLSAYYCEKDIGDCNNVGMCIEKPTICPDLWDPVCGCDGNTYSNNCYAAGAGVSVDYIGECRKHCLGNVMCEINEYCLFEGCAIETGVCVSRPTICPDLWDPVCGCDGNTYSNNCYAAGAGVSVDYRGQCKF